MNEKQSVIKPLLSFILVVVFIIATAFGINLPYDGEDALLEETEKVEVNEEAPVEDTVEDSSQDSAPTDEETEVVDNSGDTEVAEPTEDDKTATEGDEENA